MLVLGTGSCDGGYFFEGELVLVDLATGEHRYLFADDCRREVRSLEWTDAHTLWLLLAPPDDWQDRAARSEGHRVDLVRPDWRTVPARSVRHQDLAGPRVPAPLPEPTHPVAGPDPGGPRPGEIRSLTVLPGGDILLTADHALLERWSAEGDRRWSLPAGPDLGGGRTAAVLADGASAWVEALVPRRRGGGAFLRICLAGGTELARRTTPGAAALVTTSEGPLLVPMPGGTENGPGAGSGTAPHTPTGTPRARGHVHVRGVPVIPTALTVTGPGRLLPGTGDARVLRCRLAVGPERDGGA
ncbi:hypothetical protein [Streptomyces sp. 3211]|uniref:hypothetical protein n=1 Tax=Streptomyces sp. 3211 TaxID=1964449 RepID=UPI0009A54F88|nr:hypothetical protein [Streptomyces sp. 3211]